MIIQRNTRGAPWTSQTDENTVNVKGLVRKKVRGIVKEPYLEGMFKLPPLTNLQSALHWSNK
jgi:hypothetical protein